MANREVIKLITDLEDTSPRAMNDRELEKAFAAITERASNGKQDAEDIAFAISRRDYLNDTQLKLITGKTADEIESDIAKAAKKADK